MSVTLKENRGAKGRWELVLESAIDGESWGQTLEATEEYEKFVSMIAHHLHAIDGETAAVVTEAEAAVLTFVTDVVRRRYTRLTDIPANGDDDADGASIEDVKRCRVALRQLFIQPPEEILKYLHEERQRDKAQSAQQQHTIKESGDLNVRTTSETPVALEREDGEERKEVALVQAVAAEKLVVSPRPLSQIEAPLAPVLLMQTLSHVSAKDILTPLPTALPKVIASSSSQQQQKHGLVVFVEKIGLKNASIYHEPSICVSIVDEKGNIVGRQIDAVAQVHARIRRHTRVHYALNNVNRVDTDMHLLKLYVKQDEIIA